jgi:hypothetical protein
VDNPGSRGPGRTGRLAPGERRFWPWQSGPHAASQLGLQNDVAHVDGVQARGVRLQIWKSPSGTVCWQHAIYSRGVFFFRRVSQSFRLDWHCIPGYMHRGQHPAYSDPHTISVDSDLFFQSPDSGVWGAYMRGGRYSGEPFTWQFRRTLLCVVSGPWPRCAVIYLGWFNP